MGNTINDLYLKYANKVGRTLENDRYFQYLFEMVQAGSNVFQQKYQVMHKVVDEKWISVIEDSLDAINTIIDKPRRFVTTKEEVVPVALAKKITADSVRHLSMNTQFIASSKDGDIQPTRVLNVSTEESFNLYENRFIYHLIQRLVTFIDKRTDVIFWATGDETQNVLNFQSQVDDAYEEIQYKIEMTVKNRQSFAENESDNMMLFMRIDRVRRMVLALKHSSFCDIMAGCSKVRSPIQRTNLIMKDPNYRTCYQLWQFLESYDDVGYSIEVQDKALEFDEEYVIQMYTNLITNYTVFKSLLDDSRRLEEVENAKRRLIKPKFIKKIKEEIVEDRNLEDVEIRRVFVEEVTEAQLEAEAKLAEETEARKQAEQALEDMDAQMIALQQQISNLMMMNQEAEVRAEEERLAKEEALSAKEEAEKAREEALEQAGQEQQARITAEENARTEIAAAQEQAKAEITAARETAAGEIAATRQQADAEMAETKQKAEAEIRAAKEQAASEIQTAKEQAASEIQAAQEQAASEIQMTKEQAEQEIRTAQETAEKEIQDAEERAEESRRQAQEAKADAQNRVSESNRKLEELRTDMTEKLQQAREGLAKLQQEKDTLEAQALQTEEDLKKEIQQTRVELSECKEQAQEERLQAQEERQRAQEEIQQTREEIQQAREREAALLREAQEREEALERRTEAEHEAQERIAELERYAESLRDQLDEANLAWENLEDQLSEKEREIEEAKERERLAQERADANTLSHYIISALNNRRRKNDRNEDDE